MPTRVLEFRAALPLTRYPLHARKLLGAALIEKIDDKENFLDQHLAYRNQVVLLELYRREQQTQAMFRLYPEIEDMQEQYETTVEELEDLREQINYARKRVKSRIDVPALEVQITNLRATEKHLRTKLAKAKARAFALYRLEGIKHKVDDVETLSATAQKSLARQEEIVASYSEAERRKAEELAELCIAVGKEYRARYTKQYKDSPLHWGVKNAICEGVEASRKGPPPKERQGDGQFTFSTQLQKRKGAGRKQATYATWNDLLTTKTWAANVRLAHIPREQVVRKAKDGREILNGKQSYHNYMLQFRVGVDEENGWVEIPFIFRPERWPINGQIKSVNIRRRKLRSRFQWLVQFVVTSDEFVTEVGTGTVGVHLNYRLVKEGIRVAYFDGSDGINGELVLPHEKFLDRWEYVEAMQSDIDMMFNEVKEKFRIFMEERERNHRVLPDWLVEEAKGILAEPLEPGEKPRKLSAKEEAKRNRRGRINMARMVWDWRSKRFRGDEQIFKTLEEWRRYDNKPLVNAQKEIRGRTNNRRNDAYKKFAAELRERYGTVCIGDVNYQRRMRKAKAEEQADAQAVKSLAQKVAMGKLKLALMQSGMEVVLRDPAYTTATCHYCGCINDFSGDDTLVKCEGCGREYDRDHNTAINIRTDIKRPKVQKKSA